MDSKKDWHYGKKTKTLLSKRKKNKGNISAIHRFKKANINQTTSTSSNTTSIEIIPEDNFQNNSTSEIISPLKQYENVELCSDDKNNTSEFVTPNKENENGELCYDDPWEKLEGRRIVDLKHIFQSLQSIHHLGFDCSFKDLEFVKENRKGYYSTFQFICKVCDLKEQIHSENVKGDNININMAIISATVNSGQGYSQLEEFSATLNMPNMSNRLYQELHTEMFMHVHDIAWKEMESAGLEEKRLAIENGDLDPKGCPKIAVIADGAWSKRSYKTNYNALSGVACIVGARTKKILYIGVRNKYCCVCQASKKNGNETKHLCYKNWNAPSTAMEADIIVDGFKQSLIMHGLIYSQLIDEQNHVLDLKRLGLWDDICRVRNVLVYHIESLMYNHNNNAAELYNSILAKFVGGKRVNFCLKGSYELRCNAAVTAYNSGANRLSIFNKHVTTKSPGQFTKRYIKKYELSECRRRRRRLFSTPINRSTKNASAGPDEEYGNVINDHDPLSNLTDTEYSELESVFLKKLKLTDNEICSLEDRTKRQHQCDEWHLDRKKRLKRDQQEFIDHKGLHVVVGHYLGDANNAGTSANLTDELLNRNMFDPKPKEGRDGNPVIIPPHMSSQMQKLYRINRFNLMASDRIPLNRSLPDVRKKSCRLKKIDIDKLPSSTVIIVFHNEAWSTLMRTVQSVIDRSPKHLLNEIILVDDASTRKFLEKELDDYVSKLPVLTRIIRSPKRIGLIKARLMGARQAKGKILVFLDAHCECTLGWLEALVSRVAEDRKRIVCPVIDIISDETFAYVRSFELHWGAFNWDLHFRWYTRTTPDIMKGQRDITQAFRTPAMAGGLFAMDKSYFFELGGYDERMEIWGGENLELSFRVWQCGGSIEIAPCSHVGHVFRKSSPYTFPGGVSHVLYTNLARVALVWMDEWQEFYFRFNPEADKYRDEQQIRTRLELKDRLKCKGFKWYLENVWPEHFFPTDKRFFGKIKHMLSNRCLEKPSGRGSLNQPMGPVGIRGCDVQGRPSLSLMFVMAPDEGLDSSVWSGSLMTDESVCLDTPELEVLDEIALKVRIVACTGQKRQRWKYDAETMNLIHMHTDLCLDLPSSESSVVLKSCTDQASQKWILEQVPWR